MGDALCGPSNALQSFQKHASVDRTLQQDRAVPRPHPAQGFRSHNPNQGVLDREFDAFETSFNNNGPSFSELHQHSPHHHQPPPLFAPTAAPSHTHHFPSPGMAAWATDFQKLHISPVPTQSAPQNAFQEPQYQQQGITDWHRDFHPQQPPQSLQNLIPFSGHVSYGGTMGEVISNTRSQFPIHDQTSHQTQPNQSLAGPTFDEFAFEAAFAQAHAEIVLQEGREKQPTVAEQEGEQNVPPSETIRIGSDRIPAETENVDNSDELAKAAGQLLQQVGHEQNPKFKESNFMALMRQLRDREVVIDGDQIRQPLHPGGQFYPVQERLESEAKSNGSALRVNVSPNHSDLTRRPDVPVNSNFKPGSGDSEDLVRSTTSTNLSFSDNNALYEGLSLEALAVGGRAARSLNCIYQEELVDGGPLASE